MNDIATLAENEKNLQNTYHTYGRSGGVLLDEDNYEENSSNEMC